MIRFFRYQGSKEHIVNIVRNLSLINSNYKIYIEPFLGSGTVFINIPDVFDQYIVNDIDENVISIWKAILEYSYGDYRATDLIIKDKFGDIKESKESYYKFRDYYNEFYHFTNAPEKGLFLYFLANSCINSMLRFGPNGMNQSFGNRLFIMKENEYNIIKHKLSKAKIFNTDYQNIIRGRQNSVIYLDPPYFQRHTSYTENFNEDNLIKLIELISYLHHSNNIFYSDIETKISDKLLNLNFTKITAKEMRNISPLRNQEFIDKNEVLYHNIKNRFFI